MNQGLLMKQLVPKIDIIPDNRFILGLSTSVVHYTTLNKAGPLLVSLLHFFLSFFVS